MKRFLLALLIAVPAVAANVSGRALYQGKQVTPGTINMSSQPECAKAHKAPVPKEEIIVNDGGLANVFVYVKEGLKPNQIPPGKPAPVTLDQQGCLYVPRVIGVQVGQTLRITNSDPLFHNVNGQAKVNKKFNEGMVNKTAKPLDQVFTKPEVMLKLRCDVHGWMNAYIGVVDNPFFAVTGPKGDFAINGLPPGEYTLEAWHEKLGTQTAKVKVAEGTATPSNFTFVNK